MIYVQLEWKTELKKRLLVKREGNSLKKIPFSERSTIFLN